MDPATVETNLPWSGFTQVMMRKSTKRMSGGWRMHVALARALFVKPHFLDEATKHLDL